MLLVDLYRLRPTPYVHACTSPRAPWVVSALVLLTGIIYGALMAVFQLEAGGEMAGIPVAEVPFWVLAAGSAAGGIIIAVAAHVGIAIIAWLMAKAVGGPGYLVAMYRATAYLLPFAWLALPWVTRENVLQMQPGADLGSGAVLLVLALLGFVLFLAGLFQIYVLTQERGPARAGIAVALFAVFSVSVIWLSQA